MAQLKRKDHRPPKLMEALLEDIRTASNDLCVVDLWDQAGPWSCNEQMNRPTFHSAFAIGQEHSN